jgi:hypothetical protein
MEFIKSRYNKGDLLKLFLVCAFPIHAWAIFMVLRDISWVAERTNSWDAVGVIGYTLLIALVESIITVVVVLLLSFLVPKSWSAEKRIAIMSILVLTTSVWAMIAQAFFLVEDIVPKSLLRFLAQTPRPLLIIYGSIGTLVIASNALPVYFLIRSEKFVNAISAIVDRLILLSTLYIFLDFVGIVIIIIRNI